MLDRHPRIDLMIGGAQKAGTTSLKAYLAQHPEIKTHPQVECSFFQDDAQYFEGNAFLEQKYFSGSDAGKKLLAKHATLYRSQKALERFRNDHPSAHLVLLLRDPVERAYSSYLHQLKMRQEVHSFSEVLDRLFDPEADANKWRWRYNIYLGLGCYASFLETIFSIFHKEQVSLFLTERLEREPQMVCREIQERLGVDPFFQPETSREENRASVPRSRTPQD